MRAKDLLQLALATLGFPAYWPLVVVRNAALGARYRSLLGRQTDSDVVLRRIAAGDVKRATVHLRTTYTMASGPESEGLVELTLPAGRAIAPDTEAMRHALAEAKVRVTILESEVAGIGGVAAWGLWLLLVLAVAASWRIAWVQPGLAASAVLGAIAFGLRPSHAS